MEKLIIITIALFITTNINAQTNIIIIYEEDPFLKTISTPGISSPGPVYQERTETNNLVILGDESYFSEYETDVHVFLCPINVKRGDSELYYYFDEDLGRWKYFTSILNRSYYEKLLWSTIHLIPRDEALELNEIIDNK